MSSPNTLINLTGFQDGIAADETGINIEKFTVEVEPEFRNIIPGKYGTARGVVVAPMKADANLSGEVSGSTGIMAATAGTATTLANSTSYFGAPTTGFYLTKGTVHQEREQGKLKNMEASFQALSGVP